MNKHVWILYPCASRKKYTKMNQVIIMLKQYATYHGYKVNGCTILEKSFLNDKDIEILIQSIQESGSSYLLVESLSSFCRDKRSKDQFIANMKMNKINIIDFINEKLC